MKDPRAILRVDRRYPHGPMMRLAEWYRERLSPHCERVEIAGSLRRGAEFVKDIELVVVPKWEPRAEPVDKGRRRRVLRSDTERNLLYEWALREQTLQWVTPQCVPKCAPDPDGHAWFALIRENGHPLSRNPESSRPAGEWIKIDIFITERAAWGKHFLIRTGPAEYSAAVFAWAKRAGYPQLDNVPHAGEFCEEEDVYAAIGIMCPEPRYRDERAAIRLVSNLGAASRIGRERAMGTGK